MGQYIESATSWLIALIMMAFASLIVHASVIMTFGGLILLGLRICVDGAKAVKTWKGERDDR